MSNNLQSSTFSLVDAAQPHSDETPKISHAEAFRKWGDFNIANGCRNESRAKKMTSEKVVIITDEIYLASREVVTSGMQRKEYASIMEQLRDDYRMVLSLRFINGLTPEETSQVMGRSIGAVRVLQHRALTAFRKLVPQQGFEM